MNVPPVKLKDKWPDLAQANYLKPDGKYTGTIVQNDNQELWYLFAGDNSECMAYHFKDNKSVKFQCITNEIRPDPSQRIGFIYSLMFGYVSVLPSSRATQIG